MALTFILITVFIDMLGLGILIPIIPFVVREFSPSAFSVGLLSMSFAIFQFIATPILGSEGPFQAVLNIGNIDMITSGSDARFVTLGARFVGEETLNRFYILHCIAIPLAAAFLIAIHFWRVRKDGGISGPL